MTTTSNKEVNPDAMIATALTSLRDFIKSGNDDKYEFKCTNDLMEINIPFEMSVIPDEHKKHTEEEVNHDDETSVLSIKSDIIYDGTTFSDRIYMTISTTIQMPYVGPIEAVSFVPSFLISNEIKGVVRECFDEAYRKTSTVDAVKLVLSKLTA